MNNKEVPVSRYPASILSVSCHSYRVKHDHYPGIARDCAVEIVPITFVRPRPPLVQGVESFVSGDVIEVFYQYSWKIAVILNLLRGGKGKTNRTTRLKVAALQNQFLVKLVGSSQELVVDRSIIRTRQTWHDDKWILIGKISRSGDDVMASKPSISNCFKKIKCLVPQFNAKNRCRKDCAYIQEDAALWESPVISSRSLKRMSPYNSSIIEAHNGHARKLRATEKGRKQRVVADPVLEKVDAVAYPKVSLGEKYVHSSCNIISHWYNQMERAKQNNVLGHFSGARCSEINSSDDSDCSSVGSCSVNNRSQKSCFGHFMPVRCQETDTLCSDAESSYGSGSERKSFSLPPKTEPGVSIHRLEVHAYRSTLEALYTSGPLELGTGSIVDKPSCSASHFK